MLSRLRRLSCLICWRLRVPLVVVPAIFFGFVAGAVTLSKMRDPPDPPWPYDTIDRRLVGANGTSKDTLVEIPKGGNVTMQRLLEYHDLDWERWYARRAVSQVKDEFGGHPVYRFPEIHDMRLPADLSGRWQDWSEALPEDFPCGPAYLVETVTAEPLEKAKGTKRLQKPDIITPFTVTCPVQGR